MANQRALYKPRVRVTSPTIFAPTIVEPTDRPTISWHRSSVEKDQFCTQSFTHVSKAAAYATFNSTRHASDVSPPIFLSSTCIQHCNPGQQTTDPPEQCLMPSKCHKVGETGKTYRNLLAESNPATIYQCPLFWAFVSLETSCYRRYTCAGCSSSITCRWAR